MKKRILKVALITIALLLVPFLLMLLQIELPDPGGTPAVLNWTLGDFVVMGFLIFITGLLIDFMLRRMTKFRTAGVVIIVLAFLWLWVELAVGLFTNWGS